MKKGLAIVFLLLMIFSSVNFFGAGLDTKRVSAVSSSNMGAVALGAFDYNFTEKYVNLIRNPGFEQGLDGWEVWSSSQPNANPPSWSNVTVDSSISHSGNNSVRITQHNFAYGHLVQRFYPSAQKMKFFAVSGWAKSENATFGSVWFDMLVDIYYDDGTAKSNKLEFSHGTHDWEYKSSLISADGTKTIKFIQVLVRFSEAGGTAWFDDISFAWVDSTVEITVLDKESKSLSNATAKAYQESSLAGETNTDENGKASFLLANNVTFSVAIYWEGSIVGGKTFKVSGDMQIVIPTDVSFETRRITVLIRDFFDQPLPNSIVEVRVRKLSSVNGSLVGQFVTDQFGNTEVSIPAAEQEEITALYTYDGKDFTAQTIVSLGLDSNALLKFPFIKLLGRILSVNDFIFYSIIFVFLGLGIFVVSYDLYRWKRKLKEREILGGVETKNNPGVRIPIHLHVAKVLYLLMISLSFYLLFISRQPEMIENFPEVLHPYFMPLLFATTLLLLIIVSSVERIESKLTLIVLHSILIHSLIFALLPTSVDAGDPAGILGRSRRVYDNVSSHGTYGFFPDQPLFTIFLWIRGDNFQSAVGSIFARMFGIDVYWSHALVLPLLWGIFVPLVAFAMTRKLGANETVSALSSLLISLIPSTVIWGAQPVPNSFGFLYFFFSVYFSLRYITSGGFWTFLIMAAFSLMSFLSHFLTGVVAFGLLFLALCLRKYSVGRHRSPRTMNLMLLLSFVISISLLPLALVGLKSIYPIVTYFSLTKLQGLPTADVIWMAIFGAYVNFDLKTALINGLGPVIGFLGLVYYTLSSGVKDRSNFGKNFRVCILFLLLGFLVISIDYDILKLAMMDVPFGEERVWLLREFLVVPILAIVASDVINFLHKVTITQQAIRLRFPFLNRALQVRANWKFAVACIMVFVTLSSWLVASAYYAYPRYSLLATSQYEQDAVKFIDKTTSNKRYIVVADQWITYAGEAIVGIYNPVAYYMSPDDYRLNDLVNRMFANPSQAPLIEALAFNNASVAYYIIEKPRMTATDFDRLVRQASVSLRIYGIFGDGKLYVFYYEKTD